MTGAEGVMLALLALEEARETTLFPNRLETLTPSGDELVRVALMPHVPDKLVPRRIKNVVQRQG